MFKSVMVLSFFFATTCAEKDKECSKNIALYEAMKCKPIYGKKGDVCPLKYDCSFVMKTPEDKCHFHGKYYGINEVLDSKKTSALRLTNCKCKKQENNNDFECKTQKCPLKENEKEACYEYFKNPLDACPKRIECGPLDKLLKCRYRKKKILEGMLFNPYDKPNQLCVCQKSTKKIRCEKILCANEAGDSMKIRNYYAPLYTYFSPFCPYGWIEPGKDIRNVDNLGDKSGPKCKYGKKDISYGSTFAIVEKNKKVTCSCDVPPFLTCFNEN